VIDRGLDVVADARRIVVATLPCVVGISCMAKPELAVVLLRRRNSVVVVRALESTCADST
jgi:hypothetical protein